MAIQTNRTSVQSVRCLRSTAIEPAQITLMCWMRRAAFTGEGNASVIAKSFDLASTAPFISYDLEIDSADQTIINFGIGGPVSFSLLPSPAGSLPNLGIWAHVAGVYDPALPAPQRRLYVDGVQVAADTLTDAITYDTTPDGDFWFSQDGSGTNLFAYAGETDDTRIYNRALRADEILSIFNLHGDDGITDGLVARWTLNERADKLQLGAIGTGNGVTVYDVSPVGLSRGVRDMANPTYQAGIVSYRKANLIVGS